MTLLIACLLIYNFHMAVWWYAVGVWAITRAPAIVEFFN